MHEPHANKYFTMFTNIFLALYVFFYKLLEYLIFPSENDGR